MKLPQILAATLLAMSVAAAPALAADDASNFLLTPALIKKIEAMNAEAKKIKGDKEDEDDDASNAETVEELKKVFEKDKVAMALMAKHGVTSREMASASFAMIHAGFYVAFEESMDKKKAAQMFAGYTKEQQANIALMRKMKPKK
jgi:hypothetical protein